MAYDDNYRNFVMPFAAAAYSDNPYICVSNVQKYFNETLAEPSVYRQYKAKCDSLNDTCSGYIALYNGYIIISFAGIKNYIQFFQQNWNYKEMVLFVTEGTVSKQFYDAFNNIWINAGMKDDVLTLKNRYPSYMFIVVGHSIGGAMASLAAGTLFATRIITGYFELFTFGQPRTGDKTFANAYQYSANSRIDSTRIVHNRDSVPHLPPLNDSNYYHHLAEIWYPNDMKNDTFIFCNDSVNGENPNCSDSLNGSLSYDDHKYYFGREFSKFGIDGCPNMIHSK